MNKESLNFIEKIVEEHNETGRFEQRVLTRFPPEPSGYLHLGHAKAICINFGIAKKYGGKTNLRFDDTNPINEKEDYVKAMIKDIHWLGFDWEESLFFASDYFQKLYDYAVDLIKKGFAYVDHSSKEEIDQMKKAGKNSPYRDRSIEENLHLFEQMKAGEFPEGTCILRAKIDMQADNRLMRDPSMYRILHKETHHRTGKNWLIYPMYDWAHGLCDSIEGITHSLCSLEFEVHRPLYDWFLEKLGVYQPQQIEFSRLNVDYTITSKRRLRRMIDDQIVLGWDDPRMPTISAMRRRGYRPEAIRNFIDIVGVSKREQMIELSLLEECVRRDLNKVASRVFAVFDPIKVIITNYPEGNTEIVELENNPEDPNMGQRTLAFSREIYIERSDFRVKNSRKYYGLAPGKHMRLKGAYIICCQDYKLDENGEVLEVHCTYEPSSRSGEDTSGLKPKGTRHWLPVKDALEVDVRMYDRLFTVAQPLQKDEEGKEMDFYPFLNPESSLQKTAYIESSIKTASIGTPFQFYRNGYFCIDSDSTENRMVFNLTVSMKDSYKKKQKPKN